MRTKVAFWISFATCCLFPSLFPSIRLSFFAPYLILCLYHFPHFKVWVRSVGCSVIVDLLSSTTHFGTSALNFLLVILLLSPQRRHFFEDKLSTVPILSALFSSLSTLFMMIWSLLSTAEKFSFSWKWIATDLLIMPLADATYAFVFFCFPFYLIHKLNRMILQRKHRR